jgi:hypothetical protein
MLARGEGRGYNRGHLSAACGFAGISCQEIPIMARKCLYFLFAGMFLQMPVLARADTPEERIQKLESELEKSKKEVEKLKEERDRLVKEKETLDSLLKELVLEPELRKKLGLPPKTLEQEFSDKAKKELEKLREERDRLAKEKAKRDERIKRMMEDVERLTKENNSLSPGQLLWDPPPLPELNIPKSPRNEREGGIKGTITGAAENLVTISIGSDQGVKVDQIFQVYRLMPDPAYLGTLKITNVESHRAAGRFTPATKNAKIKKGDTVDSKVIGAEDNNEQEEKTRRYKAKYEEQLRELWPPFPHAPLYPLPLGECKGTIAAVVDNVAMISIGRDQGVTENLMCQVYRLEPGPKYLGTLLITHVEKNIALGRFTPDTKDTTIKKGDAVDWVIIPR